jgi:hypothetical protein
MQPGECLGGSGMRQLSFGWRAALVAAATFLLTLAGSSAARASAAPAQAGCAGSCVAISPASGPPGTKVTAAGADWPAGDQIQAIWGSVSGPNVGSPVTVASDGTFTLSFAVPAGAALGDTQVFFWDIPGRYFEIAGTPFDVTPPVSVAGVSTWGYFLQNGDRSNKAAAHSATQFTSGEVIEYVGYVSNSGSAAITETYSYVVTGPTGGKVYSWSGPVAVAPGTNGYILPSVIPNAPPSGTYTIAVTVSLNGSSTSKKATFTVAGGPRKLGTGLVTKNPYPFGHTRSTGQCTYGADQILASYTRELYYPNGRYLQNLGDAFNWSSKKPVSGEPRSAFALGWAVTSTPQLNSIAVFPKNYIPGEPAGHVGWVTKVQKVPNGYNITVDEMNAYAGPGYYDYHTYTPAQDKNVQYILATDTSRNTWAQVAAAGSDTSRRQSMPQAVAAGSGGAARLVVAGLRGPDQA